MQSTPEDIVIGGQRYLLVGAKGVTKTKFPKLKKTKSPVKKEKEKGKKSTEEQRKKEIRLRDLANLIKKLKLTGEEKEELDDLVKMFPEEAKRLRSALPKGSKQKVEKTEDEKGEDWGDSLSGDEDVDEEDDDEEEDVEEPKEEVRKTKTQVSPPAKKEEKKETKVKKEKRPKPSKGGKGQKGKITEEEKGKPKRDVLKSLMDSQSLDGDDEDKKGKRGRGDEGEEEEDLTSVPKLDKDTSEAKAKSMFKELNSDIDEDEDDADTIRRKREFQDSMVRHVDVGLDKDESEERRHLRKKKESVGLQPHEERRLSKLDSKAQPMAMHYDDLEPYEQKELREKWIEDKGKELLEKNEGDIQDNEKTHSLARAAAKGKNLSEDDAKEVTRIARKDPERAKAIFHSHGVDLSIPEEEDHPAAWTPIHNKVHLDENGADKAVVKYHLLQEKSKEGDYEAQQEFTKLKKVMDNPHNFNAEGRAALDKAGIKTKWNPRPEGAKSFGKEHSHILEQSKIFDKKQEEKAKRKEEENKAEKAKKDDSKLDSESILGRDHDDLVDQYHRLLHKSKSDTKSGRIAKKKLKKLQKVLDSRKLPQKLKDRLDAEGIPTKDNPEPKGKDVHDVKQWREQSMEKQKKDREQKEKREKEEAKNKKVKDKEEEEKIPEERRKPEAPQTSNKEEDNYESVEDYKKNVGKCPPGYSWDEEKKKCVVREDAKKDEIWKPKKERQQGVGEKLHQEKQPSPQEAALNRGSNVAKVMGNFDNLSMPSQKKVLTHAASGTSDLAEHLHAAKSPEQRKGVLSVLKRIGAAIKPHLASIFRLHKDEAKAIGSAFDKAHHVAALGKDTKTWTPREMTAKTVSSAIDNIDKVKP